MISMGCLQTGSGPDGAINAQKIRPADDNRQTWLPRGGAAPGRPIVRRPAAQRPCRA